MRTRQVFVLLAAGVAMAAMASPTRAVTLTQTTGPQTFTTTSTTLNTVPITFAGFNAGLGTLTGVKLTNSAGANGWTATFGGSQDVGQFTATSRTYSTSATPGFFFGDPNSSSAVGTSISPTLTGNPVTTSGSVVTLPASGTYTNSATNSFSVAGAQAYWAGTPQIVAYNTLWNPSSSPVGGGFFDNNLTLSGQIYLTYEYTPNPPPPGQVPGPLPILGVGTAFGFSRKLRKRIRSSAA